MSTNETRDSRTDRSEVDRLMARLHEAQLQASRRIRELGIPASLDHVATRGHEVRRALRFWSWHFSTHHRDLVRIRGTTEEDTAFLTTAHFIRQAQEEFGRFLGEVACLSDDELDQRLSEEGPTIRQILEHVIEELTAQAPDDVERAWRNDAPGPDVRASTNKE